jgi:hypothetical protein
MTEQPEATPLRSRTIAHIHLDDGHTTAVVEHVYAPEGAMKCSEEGCDGGAHDPGMVGLLLADGGDVVSGLMSPEDALLLANRLTRAANLVLESEEDVPDVEREAARFGPVAP